MAELMYVNTPLRGEHIREFKAVKEFLGIANNADVIRHLVHKEARAISREAHRIQDAAAPLQEVVGA